MTGTGSGSPVGRKRFYEKVGVDALPDGGGFLVTLDGRGLRTPAKRPMTLPSRPLAHAIAEEWRAQGPMIEPGSMSLTRIVNSALDGVADRLEQVRADVLAYGGSDLLCYLAEGPRELIERQSRAWGPVHAWIKREHGIELALSSGVMPVAQDRAMLARLESVLGERDALELAALHVITTTTGSLLLALAVLHRHLEPADAWEKAHVDEDFQIEKWGRDDEATAQRQRRWREVEAAARLLFSLDL